jgi:hypothetical protein
MFAIVDEVAYTFHHNCLIYIYFPIYGEMEESINYVEEQWVWILLANTITYYIIIRSRGCLVIIYKKLVFKSYTNY